MTTYLEGDQEETIQLEGCILKRVTNFKYLGSMTWSSGNLDKGIALRLQSGWNNWRKTEERKFYVAEMKMSRWMSGVTKVDRIQN